MILIAIDWLVTCRSQGRFERLADSLASDSLKSGTKEQGSSVNAGNDDPYNAYEMSPDDQRQKNGSAARKRSTALSTSEEEKTGNTLMRTWVISTLFWYTSIFLAISTMSACQTRYWYIYIECFLLVYNDIIEANSLIFPQGIQVKWHLVNFIRC